MIFKSSNCKTLNVFVRAFKKYFQYYNVHTFNHIMLGRCACVWQEQKELEVCGLGLDFFNSRISVSETIQTQTHAHSLSLAHTHKHTHTKKQRERQLLKIDILQDRGLRPYLFSSHFLLYGTCRLEILSEIDTLFGQGNISSKLHPRFCYARKK